MSGAMDKLNTLVEYSPPNGVDQHQYVKSVRADEFWYFYFVDGRLNDITGKSKWRTVVR